MSWHLGGNLQPVRMICEYDWKECPTAVVSYLWSEVVTDVVDGLTGETQLWRILACMLLCSMLLRTVYYKIRWPVCSEKELTRENLLQVGLKMQDLELKINILTYKMQYGIWPLPHEIPTPSLTNLKSSVKLTLSNTDGKNIWRKHDIHGCISQCIKNSEDDKSANNYSPANERIELLHRNFLSQFCNRNYDFDKLNSPRKLEFLKGENSCKSYERLVKTAKECRKYMDEINESNKNLGLFDNSSDISDKNSMKDYCEGKKSETNGQGFLVDSKKFDQIYKQRNNGEDGECDQRFSNFNEKMMDAMFPTDNERYTLNSSNSRSRLLPPGLSITFLSDKFETLAPNEKCKGSTNETLNKVKEKLESKLWKSSRSLNNIKKNIQDKKLAETNYLVKTNSAKNTYERDERCEKKITVLNNNGKTNFERFDQFTSTDCDSSCSGNKDKTFNSISIQRASKISAEKTRGGRLYPQRERGKTETQLSNVGNDQTMKDSRSKKTGVNLQNVENQNPNNASNEITKNNNNNLSCGMKIFSAGCNVGKNLSKLGHREENISAESDSSVSFTANLIPEKNRVANSSISAGNSENFENNINLNLANVNENLMPETSRSYVVSQGNKSEGQTPMETDEDPTLISETSSQTELSKDSDTDDKSTTTLLREALEFKKELLLQIRREGQKSEEKEFLPNESSECDSDDTSRPKTENRFPSKLLDIISEEQSASSSTEKTSRTYILSRSVNDTNLCENSDISPIKNNNSERLKNSKINLDNECCGDSKTPVTATSSEYFSTNNVTDNENVSSIKIDQPVANGDGLRSKKTSPENEIELDVIKYEHSDNFNQFLDSNLERNEAKDESTSLKYSQDISNKIDSINNFMEVATSVDVGKKVAPVDGMLNDQLERLKERIDSVADSTSNKGDAKIQFFRSLSSIDSEKGISWNAISESSSSESMNNFVNALTNLESKNIDKIAEQKLMMLNSTDYEGRNFSRAGENSGYNFNSGVKKKPGLVSISDINISERGHGIMDEILEMIAHSTIFKFNKAETKDANSSMSGKKLINATSTDNHSEESDLFKSHGIMKLDGEKLQRKQEIISKLKTLDAFTKPLDISECNSEKNDNEENASPMTGRTVVYNSNINMTDKNESSTKTEHAMIEEQQPHPSSISIETEKIKDAEKSEKVNEGSAPLFTDGVKILSTQSVKQAENPLIDHQVSEHVGCDLRNNNSKCDLDPRNNNAIKNVKKNQLSKSSITNFSTDTSDSYFDVSNHDFAVSSIILTSQNSNFAPRPEDDTLKSDTSSLYVDASEYFSKILIDSSSTQSQPATSLVENKNYFSESRMNHVKTSATEDKKQEDVSTHNDIHSKNDPLTKSQSLPKSTSVVLSSDQKAQSIVPKTEFTAESKPISEKSKSKNTKSPVETQSRSSLNQDSPKRSSSLNSETSCTRVGSALSKGKTMSKSCIPVLKSRIEVPKRAKSVEAKPCSQSPVRRSSTPRSQRGESGRPIGATSDSNENEIEKQTSKSTSGSKKSLYRKQSYTLPARNNKNNYEEECTDGNKECKIVQSISKELVVTPEQCNLLSSSSNLPKECTVIYINIISDADRSETQVVDANEIIKYVNEDLVFSKGKLNPKCLSLRNITSDRTKEVKYTVNCTSDSELCKDSIEDLKSEIDKTSNATRSLAPLEQEEKFSEIESNSERIMPRYSGPATTANKLLSTSTLELSHSSKVERREIEVSVKPSVKNTSTSVSDFPDVSPAKKCSIYEQKIEAFDLSKEFIQREKIVLSEMLNSDPNFFECKKAHRLYNKLGIGFQEQPDQP